MKKVTLAGPTGVSNLPFGDGLRIGALVEFIDTSEHHLGVIEGFNAGKWTIHDKVIAGQCCLVGIVAQPLFPGS